MDPLSLTASIIAVLGAGGTISKGLWKIHQAKRAPDILLQLNNEITDLNVLVLAVDEEFRRCSDLVPVTQQEVIYKSLQRAKNIVLELQTLIEYVLTRETDAGSEVARLAWIRSADKLKEMKDAVRRARSDLNATWTVISSRDESPPALHDFANFNRHDSRRVELQLLDISMTVENLRISREEDRDLLNRTMSAHAHLLALVRQGIRQDSEIACPLNSPLVETSHMSRLQQDAFNSHPMDNTARSTVLQLSVTRLRRCEPLCICSCHHHVHHRSPSLLDSVVGRLFLGYSGLPYLLQKCDTEACQKLPTKIAYLKYVFPSWLLEQALQMTVLLSKSRGPELVIRLVRVRPQSSSIFIMNMAEGDYVGLLSKLLQKGKASVLDVDSYGKSGLYYATRSAIRRFTDPMPLCRLRLMLQEGADPLQKDHFMQSPYQLYWTFLFGRQSHQPEWLDLVDLFGHTDPIDELGFSKSHIAVLGLNAGTVDLHDQLHVIPRSEIDQEDFTGRTALSWAAQRGNTKALEILLMKGANPNNADLEGKTPLIHSENDSGCLRMLLEAGAHVNHADNLKYSKLHYTIMQNDNLVCLELLYHFGADIHDRDDRGNTLLQVAIHYDRPVAANWLLEKGVDVNSTNIRGIPAFLQAVESVRAGLMFMGKRLLHRGANYKMKNNFHEGLLHHLARHGTINTIAWLQDTNLTGLSAHERSFCGFTRNEKVSYGKTAMELAIWRRDFNEDWAMECYKQMDPDPQAWFAAFETLVNSIEDDEAARDLPTDVGASSQTTSVDHETTVEAESTSKGGSCTDQCQNHEVMPRLPGSFPKEE